MRIPFRSKRAKVYVEGPKGAETLYVLFPGADKPVRLASKP